MDEEKIDDGLQIKSSDFMEIEDADKNEILERRFGRQIRDINEHEK